MNQSRLFGTEISSGIFKPDPPLFLKSKQELKVLYVTGWDAPTTGGGYAILPAGEEIEVQMYSKGAISAHCSPVNYEKLHSVIVPAQERNTPKYNGYGLVIPIEDLERYFEEVLN